MTMTSFKNVIKTALLTIFALIVSAVSISAATFTVTNINDSGAGSLRQAITDAKAAAGADTVVFDSSFNTVKTITLASSIPNYDSPDPLTITGPGANLLTIKGDDTFRIFTLFFGTTVTPTSEVFLSGMTISNGFDNFFGGGAIFVQFGKVSITNVTVTANSGNNGGGIQLFNGATLTALNSIISNNTVTDSGAAISGIQASMINLTNTTISGNTAANSGGGIQASDSATAIINGSTFTNNTATAGNGGGVDSSTSLQVTNTSFTGNSANDGGGGINNSGTATFTNCNISNNSSSGGGFAQGGGINNVGASLTVTDSTINGNNSNRLGAGIYSGASGASTTNITNSTISNNNLNTTVGFDGGGGIYLGGNDTATIINSTISGNTVATTSSVGSGGGIYAAGILTLTNATVVNNTSAFGGGGLYRPAASGNTVNLRNSIFANNTDDGTAPDLDGTFNSQGYNLIKNTMGATINGTTTGNITGQDPMLGILEDNGGPTFTHRLLPLSPAVDAADVANFPPTDQRGVLRPMDGNPNNLVAQPDIGSYELLAPTAANATVSGRVADNGSGIANVFVSLIDVQGTFRTARTNSFGYFRFEDILVGQIYIAEINSKQYVFSPQVITVDDDVANLNFSPIAQTFPGKGLTVNLHNKKFLQRK